MIYAGRRDLNRERMTEEVSGFVDRGLNRGET